MLKKPIRKTIVERGIPFSTIKKKFKTVGEMRAYYKKHKIKLRTTARI